jgi:type II secretory pathway pseudopilin PulG
MKRIRRGFTLVEVSLFLAITAAIFVSIAVGTQNSIFQQRYNDAVQNFAEFLRSMYSQVTNVQSEGDGRSGHAVYGKLVNFEEDENGNNKITTYNVIGDVAEDDLGNGNVLERLASLNANVVLRDGDDYKTVGFVENYRPRWASQIQNTKGWDAVPAGKYEVFTGALLIVRHPSSGTVYTFNSKESIDVEKYLQDLKGNPSTNNPLAELEFIVGDVDFCVNPNGAEQSTLRRDVRIVANARNATGVEIISDDESWIDEGANRKNIGDRCE